MLICFFLLRFHKFGVGNRGEPEGVRSPKVAKMVNTDNLHPQRTVCLSVSGPPFQPNNKSQEDRGAVQDCSLLAIISCCSDRYHKRWELIAEAGREVSA